MEARTLLREARRHAGMSQRELARVSGISLRTLVGVEGGQVAPNWTTVQRVAEVAGLTLAWVPRVVQAPPEVRDYLRLSTGARLQSALWRGARPGDQPVRLERQLADLSRRGDVHLEGPSAVPVWVQDAALPRPLAVRVHQRPGWPVPVPAERDHPACHLLVQVVQEPLPLPLVRTRFPRSWTVYVDDPARLALREDCAAWAPQLRAAARLLTEAARRDDAGRQRPPHRDPDERREAGHLFHVKGFRRYALPDDADSRSWRVGGEVSLAQWKAVGRPIKDW